MRHSSSKTDFPYVECGTFVLLILLTLASVFRGALCKPEGVQKALVAQGYKDVKIIKHAWVAVPIRGCGTGDAARFTVEAKTPAGNTSTFFVCSGWLFKSMTIRFD